MTKYVSKDGKHTTTTTNPSERVDLLNQGYREQKETPAGRPEPAPAERVAKVASKNASK